VCHSIKLRLKPPPYWHLPQQARCAALFFQVAAPGCKLPSNQCLLPRATGQRLLRPTRMWQRVGWLPLPDAPCAGKLWGDGEIIAKAALPTAAGPPCMATARPVGPKLVSFLCILYLYLSSMVQASVCGEVRNPSIIGRAGGCTRPARKTQRSRSKTRAAGRLVRHGAEGGRTCRAGAWREPMAMPCQQLKQESCRRRRRLLRRPCHRAQASCWGTRAGAATLRGGRQDGCCSRHGSPAGWGNA